MIIAGVDFGSKTAGTTVVCVRDQKQFYFAKSAKGEDADEFLLSFFAEHPVDLVGFDAPLSLPAVYSGALAKSKASKAFPADYLFRQCDRELGAMSPMFLGGLTARAMRLQSILKKGKIKVVEVYPAALVEELGIDPKLYNKKRAKPGPFLNALREELGMQSSRSTLSWHEVDSFLCYLSALRLSEKVALKYGNPKEGTIVV